MKINWKVLFALVLVVGAVYWAFSSTQVNSYSGTNLTFAVGGGPVTMTNPSDETIAVQLIGDGSRSFTVQSSIDEVSGSSTREGSGSDRTNVFAFDLPPGASTFTVARGQNVNFGATTDTRLSAVVESMTGDNASTTFIVAVVVILGALFYASRATGHQWISLLRRQKVETPVPDAEPVVKPETGGQGQNLRAYGDNRANKED
jgi:hypothetical protein